MSTTAGDAERRELGDMVKEPGQARSPAKPGPDTPIGITLTSNGPTWPVATR